VLRKSPRSRPAHLLLGMANRDQEENYKATRPKMPRRDCNRQTARRRSCGRIVELHAEDCGPCRESRPSIALHLCSWRWLYCFFRETETRRKIIKRQGRRCRGGIATAKRPDAALAEDLWSFTLGAEAHAGKVVRVLLCKIFLGLWLRQMADGSGPNQVTPTHSRNTPNYFTHERLGT